MARVVGQIQCDAVVRSVKGERSSEGACLSPFRIVVNIYARPVTVET